MLAELLLQVLYSNMRNESKKSFWNKFTIKALMKQSEEIQMYKKVVRELQKLLNRETINKMKADKKNGRNNEISTKRVHSKTLKINT